MTKNISYTCDGCGKVTQLGLPVHLSYIDWESRYNMTHKPDFCSLRCLGEWIAKKEQN